MLWDIGTDFCHPSFVLCAFKSQAGVSGHWDSSSACPPNSSFVLCVFKSQAGVCGHWDSSSACAPNPSALDRPLKLSSHTKLSSMLEHSRKESTSLGLISCWWSVASMLSGHPAASLLRAACRAQGEGWISEDIQHLFNRLHCSVWHSTE